MLNTFAGISPLIKFGSIQGLVSIDIEDLLPQAILMGILGGCMGSFFININTRCAAIRKKYLTEKWMKPIETLVFSFITASVFYWVTFGFRDACIPIPGTQEHITLVNHKPIAGTSEISEEEED